MSKIDRPASRLQMMLRLVASGLADDSKQLCAHGAENRSSGLLDTQPATRSTTAACFA